MEIASAYVSLLPSARGFGRKLESDISGEVDGAAKRTGSKFGNAFKVGAVGALAGGALLAGFLGDALAEARDAQVIGARTENVIAKMGNAANISAGQVGKLAEAISTKTGIDDEAIQSGQNLLLTFGNIRNEAGKGNDIFNQTSKLMVDMSAAMGTDAKGSAIQLGKALNDPVKGLTALSRVGVSFTAQQQEQIKALVATGNTMGAQKIILGELERQFGGAAESMATPAMKAAVAWGNFKEQIGTALLPVVDRLLTTLSGQVIPAISNFFTQMQTGAGVGGQVAASLQAVGRNLGTIVPVIGILVAGLATYRVAMLASAAAAAIQAAGTTAATGATWSLNTALRANPIGLVVTALTALGVGLVIAYKRSETFRGMVNALWGALKVAGGWLLDIARKIGAFAGEILGRAIPAIRSYASFLAGAYVGAVRSAIGIIGNIISALARFGSVLADGVQAAARFASGVIDKGSAVLSWFAALPGKVAGYLAALGARMYAAGAEAVSMLASGIRARAGAALDELKSLAGKLAALIPGSPVKDGPLKSLNKGHAGGQMMKMLADGIKAEGDKPADAMKKAMEKVREELTSKRDDIKSVLEGLKNDFKSLSDSIASTFAGNLFDAQARDAIVPEIVKPEQFNDWSEVTQQSWMEHAERLQKKNTTAAMSAAQVFVQNLMGTKGQLTKLKGAFQKLVKWGLSPEFLSQLFQSGNGGLILDLAGGGRAQATQAGSLYGQVESLSSMLGNQVARADVGPKIDATNRRLERIERALDRLPKNFGKELNGAVRQGQRSAA